MTVPRPGPAVVAAETAAAPSSPAGRPRRRSAATPPATGTAARWARRLLPAALLLLTGCAGIFRSWSTAPSGLSDPDDALRRDLAGGRYQAASELVGPDGGAAPEDDLLWLLYRGVVAHYSGHYEDGAEALDHATALAEDRYTKSVSRGALSLVSNDRALPYTPGRPESLLIHYYAALSRLRLGDREGAAVEARRLSYRLQRYEDDGWDCAGGTLCTSLRYFAGAVFEAAGETNDAAVAYRNAAPLAQRFAFARDSAATEPSPRGAPEDSTGAVLVIVEQGYVAHRVQESLTLLLTGDEGRALEAAGEDERLGVATDIAARIVEPEQSERRRERARRASLDNGTEARGDDGNRGDDQCSDEADDDCGDDEPMPYLLRVAWPVYRDDYGSRDDIRVVGPDSLHAPVQVTADVSHAVKTEFDAARLGILARAIARAGAKFTVARTVESGVGDDHETLGQLLAVLANLGGALLEQADTRSWHLLPDALGMVRLRLPAGEHSLAVSGARGERVDLGPVDVRPGSLTIVSARLWR